MLPHTSLLDNTPFVSNMKSQLRKTIDQSYSTLSTTSLKEEGDLEERWADIDIIRTTAKSNAVGGANKEQFCGKPSEKHTINVFPFKVITYHCSKLTSSSAVSMSNRTGPIALCDSNLYGSATRPLVALDPNGICRITRLRKEREKLPDRINYDRRGLTTIPIFENEPNLRLLSLQHNLINIFHIPRELESNDCDQMVNERPIPLIQSKDDIMRECLKKSNDTKKLTPDMLEKLSSFNSQKLRKRNEGTMPITKSSASPITNGDKNCLRGSPQSSPIPPLKLRPTILDNNGRTADVLKRNFLLRNCNSYAPIVISSKQNQNKQCQHQEQPVTQCPFGVKNSRNFIAHCSKQTKLANRESQKPVLSKMQSRVFVLISSKNNRKSFDSNATVPTKDVPVLPTSEVKENFIYSHKLEIKNKQLIPSYGLAFRNLVFLDLYDNQIERIANLDGLPTLSVLLLGKNRISDISGLASLRKTLRVLDLHGNKITSISNKINCLHGLKSLNLAGNQIRQINQNDFNGLLNLKELNLKRNRLRQVNGFQYLKALERLWLCHNDLAKVEDMLSISKAENLLEVTIENNPVSVAGDCVSYLVSYLPNLKFLSQMVITDQVRQAAMSWRTKKELCKSHYSDSIDFFKSSRREEVISNARTNWELLRSQQCMQTSLKTLNNSNQQGPCEPNQSSEVIQGLKDLHNYIRLPPLQRKNHTPSLSFARQTQEFNPIEQQELEPLSGSSVCSLGPNFHSSSSCYSSDDGQTPQKERLVSRRKIQWTTPIRSEESLESCCIANNLSETASSLLIFDGKLVENKSTLNRRKHCEEAKNETSGIVRTETSVESSTKSYKANLFNFRKKSTELPISAKLSTNFSAPVPSLCTKNILAYFQCKQESKNDRCNNISQAALSLPSNIGSMSTANTTATKTEAEQIVSVTCKRYVCSDHAKSHNTGGKPGNNKTTYTGNSRGKTTIAGRCSSNKGIYDTNSDSMISINQHSSSLVFDVHTVAKKDSPYVTTNTLSLDNHVTNSNVTKHKAVSSAKNATDMALCLLNVTTPTNDTAAFPCKQAIVEHEKEQGGDYLIEICGRYLNVYGQGALRFIDKQWNSAKANDVHTLNFSYINFNNIAVVMARIKARFPHAQNFVFRETNISCLGQLNALAELQGIISLLIDPEGNTVTTKELWRQYAIYRLSHWGLKYLNGIAVTPAEINESNLTYTGLTEFVLWSVPNILLQPLLIRLRLEDTFAASKMSPKQWLNRPENRSLSFIVGKEALQWKKNMFVSITTIYNGKEVDNFVTSNILGQKLNKSFHGHSQSLLTQESFTQSIVDKKYISSINSDHAMPLSVRERCKIYFIATMKSTCDAIDKLQKLETLWPSLLYNIVRNTLLDYSQLDVYLCSLLDDMIK